MSSTETLELPSTEEEVWRYSRLNDVDFDRYGVVESASTDQAAFDAPEAAIRVVIRDGHVVDVVGDAAGVEVQIEESSSLRGAATDTIDALHDGAVRSVVRIGTSRGADVEAPIMIDHATDVEHGLVAPHTIVNAAPGSAVTVIERRMSGAADQLVLPTVELNAENDARLRYGVVQELGAHTTNIERHIARSHQQAHLECANAAFGGSYARVRTDFDLVGRGASGDLLAVYFGDGDQMLDFRTFQRHAAPDTTSKLLFKGAVTGAAQSVYSGLIQVEESAPGTNAFQTNRNLKLSDEAWAYSVPNLEIEQNQVSCSHASTVGEIDEDQRFYLESRGVPPTVAEQLLVAGFFAEVVDRIAAPSVREHVRAIIDDALAADRVRRDAA